MKLLEQRKAIDLRKGGRSIKEIARVLGVSKGSVSVWVRKTKITEKQQKSLLLRGFTTEAIEKRRAKRIFNEEQKRSLIFEAAKKELEVSKADLKIIGTALYWAEGGKTKRGMARISNSDPLMIKTMMSFFRVVCEVPPAKFRGHIHIHDPISVKKAEKYWSEVSGISLDQFFKTYTKKSKASLNKFHSLPYGTFDIYVCDTKLFLTIMGWVQKIKETTQ